MTPLMLPATEVDMVLVHLRGGLRLYVIPKQASQARASKSAGEEEKKRRDDSDIGVASSSSWSKSTCDPKNGHHDK